MAARPEYLRCLRSVRSILAVGLLGVVCAPGAHGATTTVAKSAQSGPVLAGSKVLYGVDRGSESGSGSDLGVDLRSVTVSGGRPSTLYRFTRPTNATDTNTLSGLDADGSRWATVRRAFAITGDGPDSDVEPLGADLVAGTIGKRPARLFATFDRKCSPPGYKGDASDVAIVDGGVAVGVEPGECGNRSEIELRLGRRTIGLKGTKPRGGGRWLAYDDGTAIVVYDVKLRRPSYRITAAKGDVPVVFDPQGDGKVVVVWRGRDDAPRLAWYSKAENRPHSVGVSADELTIDIAAAFVAMAADTIVLPAFTQGSDLPTATIVAVSLTGARKKVADAFGAVGLDFDGRRVAWNDQGGVHVAPVP